MLHGEITERIIGCAYSVYNALGFGFSESVYENSLGIELSLSGLGVRTQVPITVRYRDQVVGDFLADMLVEGEVVVELKAVRHLLPAHEAQLVNYLTATGKDVGLLVNFGEKGVEVRRKLRTLPERKREQKRRD